MTTTPTRNTSLRGRRPIAGGGALLVMMLPLALAGCASLSPEGDIDRAALRVGEGSAWRPDWNAPWSTDADEAWDGRTPISEDLAVTLALRNNRGIRADLETIAAARADLVQSGLLPNPVLSLAFGLPIAGTDGGTQVTIGAMQQLTELWLRPHRTAAADARLREAVLSVSDSALDLVARVRGAHASIGAADLAAERQREVVAIYEHQLDLARGIARAGESSQAAVSEAELFLAAARLRLITRERAAAGARRELLSLIGRAAAPAEFVVASSLGDDVAGHPEPPDEATIIGLAAAQRLDIAVALAQRDGASARLREAGLAGLPELSAGAMYERELGGDKMLGPTIDIEIPIFDDGSAAKARAAAEARRADLHARGVLELGIREVREAYLDYVAARDAAAVTREGSLPAAARIVALTRAAMGAGEASRPDVLRAELDLANVQLELADAELRVVTTLVALERALGGRILPSVPGQGSPAHLPPAQDPPAQDPTPSPTS